MRAMSLTVAVILAFVVTACRTMTPEVAAFQSINATAEMADASLKSWAQYCRDVEATPKRVTLATHLEVKAYWDKYQIALVSSRAAVGAYKTAQAEWVKGGKNGDPPSVVTVNVLTKTVYQFATDLVAVINKAKGLR